MMQRDRMSQIGVLLNVLGVGFVFLWWYLIGPSYPDMYGAYRISALTFAVLMAGPPAALTLAGFVLYVIGRRAFWAMPHPPKRFLTAAGLALMAAGGFFVTWFWAFSAYAANKLGPPYDRPLSYYLATSSPYFILFALWILSGFLIFADSIEAMLATRRISSSEQL
jgi:hypothetical protein